jgi:uncharacterized protein
VPRLNRSSQAAPEKSHFGDDIIMQFALNYSPEAAALVRRGAIEFDLYKCPDWEDMVAEAQPQRPVYIHFPIVLATGKPKLEFAHIERWLAKTETHYINCHLAAKADIVPSDINQDGMVEMWAREIAPLVQHFGADRIIAENTPYDTYMRQRNMLEIGADPTAIRRLIEHVGCGFLLDISHAALTCESTEHDFDEYLEALPVHRLRELHITGIGIGQQGERTDHMPMTDDDWARTTWSFERIRTGDWAMPDIIACEYGGTGALFKWRSDINVIATDIPRLYQLCQSLQPTP